MSDHKDVFSGVASGDKTAVEVYDAKHGKYAPVKVPVGNVAPPTGLDPKPFGGTK